ncbi:GyrI-like domain-containing protein [Lentibacter algarum]|uniref:GyrI-like domain-containing protein n=1 Tax=Lentibacter algarum TaxID=576131 RepID=UPI001C0778DB|nr:GyrI-like domain-containing protein [Lentibacter algarum]MBU2980584.1 GyrI-like domain-containing protein [Lentibacter algarum]
MNKTDLKKQLKEFYQPSSKAYSVVDVPEMPFVSVEGQGAPEGEAYSHAVQWLYSVIYPMKFIAKQKYRKDFVAPPLEGLWWADDWSDFKTDKRDNWKWRMMITTPTWVDQTLFDEAVAKATKKLGNAPESLKLAPFHEGKSVQIMHIGPYAEEAPVIDSMHNVFMPENGLKPRGEHHEIYISDPRRTAPEKLKTVLRQPVCDV